MITQFSPPTLYVSDDEDDNSEFEQTNPYHTPYMQTSMIYQNSPRKKRTLPDVNVRADPSVANWTKRQRSEAYRSQHIRHNPISHESEIMNYNPNLYNYINDESHSFHAFDWTHDVCTPTRNYSIPIQPTQPQIPILPSTNAMNVGKQQLNHLDSMPSYPQSHKRHQYHQHPYRKAINTPATANPISSSSSSPPSLPLPLPTPTPSYTRSHSQHIRPDKNPHIPYSHANPPALVSVPPNARPPPPPIQHSIKPVYQTTPLATYRPSAPVSTQIPISTPEVRRQPLNGTETLSAFYDSKCYRCNICKYKCLTSSALLQHLFAHIFYCNQCSFYSYSQHNLYKHIFEKHVNQFNDIVDPKKLELLYIARCSDGTFTLCMNSSPTPTPSPNTPVIAPIPVTQLPVVPPKPTETIMDQSENTKKKPKVTNRKPRQKKDPPNTKDNNTTVLPEKLDENLVFSSSSSSSTAVVAKPSSSIRDKPTNIYVLMKYRRCYSIVNPPCLHSLTLEYNVCREHTIRHICQTFETTRRQKSKSKISLSEFIDAAAACLKSTVNEIAAREENQNSTDLVCLLPNQVLNSTFPDNDLETLTTMLKLTNKYTKSIDENRLYRSESSIRSSNHHVFILSSSSTNKNEQSIFTSLEKSITDVDSFYTQTKLQKLPISYDNTHRFLKGHLNIIPRPSNSVSGTPSNTIESSHCESKRAKTSRLSIDKKSNSITSSKLRQSSSPNVIILD